LPAGAIARLGPSRLPHKVAVTALAFSPDGKWLASGGGDGETTLWQTGSLREVHHHKGLAGYVARVLFSPDSKTLAAGGTGGEPGIISWDVASGTELWRCPDPTSALAFSPDGKWLACGFTDGGMSLRDAASGKEKRQCEGHDQAVSHLLFLDGGRTLASVGRHRTLLLWDVASGKELRRLGDREASTDALGFSADGKILVAQPSSEEVLLWDVPAGKPVRRLRSAAAPEGIIVGSAGAVSPDGKWLAVGDPGRFLHLWDLSSGKEFWSAAAHGDRISALAFSPDSRTLASGGWDGMIRFWDIGRKGAGSLCGRPPSWPVDLVFSADSTRLITSSAEAVCLWDAANGKAIETLPPGTVSPDGLWVARSEGKNSLLISRLTGGKDNRRFQLAGKSFGILFSPDSQRLACKSEGPDIVLLDLATGKELRRLPGPDSLPSALRFSSDGRFLLVQRQYTSVWDLSSGKEVYRGKPEPEPAACGLSPDGKILAELRSVREQQPARLVLIEVASGRLRREVTFPGDLLTEVFRAGLVPDGIPAPVFAADGSALAFVGRSDEEHLYVMKMTARQPLRMSMAPDSIRAIAFSPDARTLATAGKSGMVSLWEVATGQARRLFVRHRGPVGRLAFSPDGHRLASASEDTTVLLWDLKTPQPAAPKALAPKDLEALWGDLAGGDAVKGYRAVQILASSGQGATFLADRLRPAPPPVNAKRLAELIGDLDSNRYTVRSKATSELEKLGDAAEPALRRALAKAPSLEARRRLDVLLDRCDASRPLAGESLREVRAVEALEHQGSAKARQVLETLAGGAADARLTREAQAALRRMKHRPTGLP
jgi:WD40 repeat protein